MLEEHIKLEKLEKWTFFYDMWTCVFHCACLESTGIITLTYHQYENQSLNLSPAISFLSFFTFFLIRKVRSTIIY